MTTDCKSFMFTGLMATECITEMEHNGDLVPSTKPAGKPEDDPMFATVPRNIRVNSRATQRDYQIVFVFENVLRELISSHLCELCGLEWFSKCVPGALREKVTQRRSNEKKNSWHAGMDREDVYYLDLNDLSKIVIHNWKKFEDFFPSQRWIESRINEVYQSRNIIAHANSLTKEESQRIALYLRDVLRQVG